MRRALIITYYWPPAGGPGVQRWLKFVKYLPEFNVEPIVYIPKNPNYPIRDESLIEEVSEDITILKRPIKEPYRFARLLSKNKSNTISKGMIKEKKRQSVIEKLMLYVRGNYFIPDARKAWVKPSVKFLSEYISKHNIEVIITTGPPHSLHLIGLQLKRRLGVKWLADFRDPWTSIGYQKQLKLTKASQQKHKQLESQVLNETNQVIVTSFTTRTEFESITKTPIEVITNGYDKNDIGNVDIDNAFTISHIGSLLSKRNPNVLWQVLKDLIEENQKFSSSFQLNLVGTISEEVLQSIKSNKLSNHINNMGYLSHKESVVIQKKSQILLLIEINSKETRGIIPGKLFEYMASNRPIIAIGPNDSDIEGIITETNTGKYFLYNDYEALKSTILEYFETYRKGTLKSHAIGLQKYSRHNLTKTLSNLI